MEKLLFRNVHLRYMDVRRKDESTPFCRLHLTADLSTPIVEAMGWTMPGPGQTDGSLAGKLVCSNLILTPNQKGLRQLDIECSEASDFKYVCGKDPESGAVKDAELRFIVRSVQEGAGGIVESWWWHAGDSACAMKLNYQRPAVQEKLDMAPPPAEGTKPAAAVAADPDDFANAEQPGSPALASHQEMKSRRRGVQ